MIKFVGNTEKAKEARKGASKQAEDREVEGEAEYSQLDGNDSARQNQTGLIKKERTEEVKRSNDGANERHGEAMDAEPVEVDEAEKDIISESEDDFEEDGEAEQDDDAEYEVDKDEEIKSATKKAKTNGGAKRVTRSMTNGKSEKPRKGQNNGEKERGKEAATTQKEKTDDNKSTSAKKPHSKAGYKVFKPKGKDGEEMPNEGSAKENEAEGSDDEHGQPGSASRLPKEGQHVFWRATPGWVEGGFLFSLLALFY